jgi:tRNA threonylcarbamoyladenosine biosynthesis protein TsaB
MRSRSFAIETPASGGVANLLAFDTSLGALSVAVVWRRHGEIIAREAFETRTSGHAEHLMPMIAEVMEEAGVAFSAIERIGVTIGPGTFTGVRVGIAAARGLALASARPLVGVSSLAVMAREASRLLPPARAGGGLAVAVDARRGMVFFQLFDPKLTAASPPLYLAPGAAVGLIGERNVILVGSGAGAVGAAISAAGVMAETALLQLQPRARSLLPLTAASTVGGPVRPLYLRPHGAEPQGDAAGSTPGNTP